MRFLFGVALVCGLGLATGMGCAETDGSAASGGTTEGFDPLQGIGVVELVADGFVFTEGPTWRSREQWLQFSAIPANTISREPGIVLARGLGWSS